MIGLSYILFGGIVAIAIEWAIFTHLFPFISVIFKLKEDKEYIDLLRSDVQKIRFFMTFLSGSLSGYFLFSKGLDLYLFSVAAWSFFHTLLYYELFKSVK